MSVITDPESYDAVDHIHMIYHTNMIVNYQFVPAVSRVKACVF